MKISIYILFLISLLLFSPESYSQSVINKLFTISNIETNKDSSIKVNYCHNFDRAIPSEKYDDLNAFTYSIPIKDNENVDIILEDISNIIIKPDSITNKNIFDSSYTYSVDYFYSKGVKNARIQIEIFRSNNNSIEQIKSFRLKIITKEDNAFTPPPKRVYAANSVLSTGDWYKIKVSHDGIYKITGSDLSEMGFSISKLPTSSVRLYGNGGGMLSENNSVARYDDLTENSIQIHDNNNNGFFDANDYFLFYAKGPQTWIYQNNRFIHKKNLYDDVAFYFITIKNGQGKRIAEDTTIYNSATKTVNSFTDYKFHENDSLNLIKTGKEWYGEQFDIINRYSFNFNFPNIETKQPILIRSNIIARSTLNSTMLCRANSQEKTINFTAISSNYLAQYADVVDDTFSIHSNNSNINVQYVYSKPNSSSQAWLNYIEISAKRHLTMYSNQMTFRTPEIVNSGKTAEYVLENANSSIEIWDISNYIHPLKMRSTTVSNTLKFKANTDSLRTFVAHHNNYYKPHKVGKVDNQNLHKLKNIDYVILYHPKFKHQAEELAEFHRSNSNLTVFTTEASKIYNEFSSGAKDITAIRDFMKMLYDKANNDPDKMPKYLLLFGDASYDYRNRVANNTNYVPTFESINSLAPTGSYSSDDYFGLLDANEGYDCYGNLDIGIGRFPITTVEEAKAMVSKVKRYVKPSIASNDNTSCANGANGISAMSDWKNIFCFIGDDGDNKDGSIHMYQANYLADYIGDNYPDYNIDKILFDAYHQVITPGGQRYPEVNQAINQRVSKGALVINYTGHGGEEGWSHESVLEVKDINAWTNYNNLPLFVTATCEFSRYDDPGRVSAGELVILNPNGGGIGLLTTSRVSYSSHNFNLSKVLYSNILEKTNGKYQSLGDLIRISKVGSGSKSPLRNFVLLGDPALCLSNPINEVVTKSIIDKKTNTEIDTLKALQLVNIEGEIHKNGQLMSNFNGTVYPTIFDKSKIYTTLNNDGDINNFKFKLQKSIIYKGKALAKNGKFSFTFVVPKDIGYNFGSGKISYYATDGKTDANGFNNSFDIGGSYENSDYDEQGPDILLYINDSQFVDGGITNENPKLLAYIFDEHGINTVGNGIGHDITAILDNNSSKPIVLNDFYQANLGDYKRGKVFFPFHDISDGEHTLSVKVWDVYNNSATAHINFLVGEKEEVIMDNLTNAPNPFFDQTSIIFEHNQSCDFLEVQVLIFDINGRLVRELNATVNASGYRVGPNQLVWNGNSEGGKSLQKGIYVYKVRIKNTDGSYKEMTDKMLLLR
jgi:hypothetical protein